MGQLKVHAGGLRLNGQAIFLDALRASTIRSRHGQPMTIGKPININYSKFVLSTILHEQDLILEQTESYPFQNLRKISPLIHEIMRAEWIIIYFWATIN